MLFFVLHYKKNLLFSDLNKCTECHQLAHCKSTFEKNKCECFDGFKGDGHHCTGMSFCRFIN